MNISLYNKTSAGYNLLMVSIALMVIGILTVGGMQIYTNYKESSDVVKTQSRVSNIVNLIQDFKNNNGRLPCPSSMNAARNLPTYGAENCSLATLPGNCADGLCVINGRTGVPDRAVVIGAVPFRLLQLDEKETYDAYGSRILYAVTRSQTVVATFNEVNGAIDIMDENDSTVVDPQGSVLFAILSNGKNKYGAFTMDGIQPVACTAGVREALNCLNFATPPTAPYTMRSSMTYLAGGATEFDDVIEYFSSTEPSRWRRVTGADQHVQTISNTNVGISGISAPTQTLDVAQSGAVAASLGVQAKLDGALRATDNINVGTGGICDIDGNNCFRPSDFLSSTQINCNTSTTNRYMTGIRGNGTNAGAECGLAKTSCPAGTVLHGFNADGAPSCAVLGMPCSLATVQICNSSHTGGTPSNATIVKSSNEVQTHSTSTKCDTANGACSGTGTLLHGTNVKLYDTDSFSLNRAWVKFTCDNGVWKKPSSWWGSNSGGLCSCTPPTPPSGCLPSGSPPTCTYTTPTCLGYATGTRTNKATLQPNCTWGESTLSHTCSCPYPNLAAAQAAGVPNPTPITCSSGYSPVLGWNASATVCKHTQTCSCVVPSPSTRTDPTPRNCSEAGLIGYTGTAYRKEKFNVSSCGWVNDGWDTSGCTCGATGSTPLSTTCDLSCQDTASFPIENWHYEVVSGICTKKIDSTTAGTCTDKVFTWQITSSTSSVVGSGSAPNSGETCRVGCPAPVSMNGACDTPKDGTSWHLWGCSCQ